MKSGDSIPAPLIGFQAIYRNEATRTELFRLLGGHVFPDRRGDTARPGMDLWAILAMGVLKRGLRCDHDRRRELANGHGMIRRMLGHGVDGSRYELENIRENVERMTPNLLREVDRLIVETGHNVVGKKPRAVLVARCGSFVVETDVHNPTDFNLLLDSVRVCGAFGVRGRLQLKHRQRKVEELYGKVSVSRKWDSWQCYVRAQLCVARKIADKAQASTATLRGTECPEAV